MSALRIVGRWLTDWRNLATVIVGVLVAMLLVGFLATLSDRQHLLHQLQDRRGEITALTVKVDRLQAELEQVLAARSDSERADVVNRFEQQRAVSAAAAPRPAVRPTSTSTRPTTTSSPPTTAPTTTSTTAPSTTPCVAGIVCLPTKRAP